MKASIIIPVVKDRGWLEDAIKSALNQDYNDYEIILASDGNSDMKKYADKYGLKFSLSNGNRLSINFNTAAKIAKGEFLKLLADDDLLTSNCLKDLIGNIGSNPLIYANAINFTEKSESVYKSPQPNPNDFQKLMSLYSSYLHDVTFLFRKDIFLENGGCDEKLKCCEWYDLVLNYLSQGYKFSYVDKVVCRYRKYSGQTSFIPNSSERMKQKIYIVNKYNEILRKNKIPV